MLTSILLDQTIAEYGYEHPEVLVSTQWVDDNRTYTTDYRIFESDEDVLLYDTAHIPEAVRIDWINDLNDPVIRDYIDQKRFLGFSQVRNYDGSWTEWGNAVGMPIEKDT